MNIYSIYKVTNFVNNKIYIGFDSNFPNRKINHQHNAYNPKYHGYKWKFYCAIRKYGCENFIWECIYQSTDKRHTLKEMEPWFIDHYDSFSSGYNMTRGGDGCIGYKHSLETLEKMRQSNLGKIHSEETKKKISLINLGRKWSDASKKKMSLTRTGRKNKSPSQEICDKQAKTYIVINPKGLLQTILNLKRFCKENNLDQPSMTHVAKGKRLSHKGWKCFYV